MPTRKRINEQKHEVALKEFGKLLAKARENKGLTQRELALLADLTNSQVGNYEKGKIDLQFSTIMDILWALEADANDLFPKTTSKEI
jgi:transcriptional regulator with XRE-family HTH domain